MNDAKRDNSDEFSFFFYLIMNYISQKLIKILNECKLIKAFHYTDDDDDDDIYLFTLF